MAGISSKAAGALLNKKKFQQYEFNGDFDLDDYESFYRTYDPQIGRFLQIDPEPKFEESLYAGLGNNPISNVDPLGNNWWERIVGTVSSIVDNLIPGSNLRELYKPTDPDDFNQTLRTGDLAMLTFGAYMTVDGGKKVAVGGVLLLAGGAGAPIAVTGAIEMVVGADITINASLNIAKGYNYGYDKPIEIPEERQIPRDQLNPPEKPGNAPTFKKDGKPVDIHHEGQNPEGPFTEMHPDSHRGNKALHPARKSTINRQQFVKQRRQYWKKYPNESLPEPKFTPKPEN